jgi:tRNA1(Val) A37 N6-methylase TrmN6
MTDPLPAEISEDALLGGRVRLLQPRGGHRAGTDAVLLAAAAGARAGETVVDLGSASGAVGLMLAVREAGAKLIFVERDETLVALCRRNIALNELGDRARAVAADVFAPRAEWIAAGLAPEQADLVASNPPFFEAEGARPSPDAARRAAHEMAGGTLAGWLETAADLLRPRGRLVMIHRADALATCLAALAPRFGTIRVTPVQARADSDSVRVLLSAVKGGKAPLSLAPALVLHEADGRFTEAVAAMHAGPALPEDGKGR